MHEVASRALFASEVAGLSPRLAQQRGWVVHETVYPKLDCEFKDPQLRPLRLVFECDGWDSQPPSIVLCDAAGVTLKSLPTNPTGIFNAGPHPSLGRPFVCMRGTREYHIHPSHTSDAWDALRGHPSYTLGGILTQLWRAWQKGWQ